MSKAPQTDPELVREILLKQVGNYDRAPFHDVVADQLANAPSGKSWKTLAEDDPAAWSRALSQNARTAGYADKVERIETKRSIHEVVALIVSTKGRETAQNMLEMLNLPLTLLPQEQALDEHTGALIEHSDTGS